MARDPKQDPYYNPDFSDEVNEVTNDFVYKKTGKQTTGDAIIVRPRGGSFDVLLIERKIRGSSLSYILAINLSLLVLF